MGFTIEDMLVVAKEAYQMELIAGEHGWSNSINWLIVLEDTTILNHFSGRELAITTGLGFNTEEMLISLVEGLNAKAAAGLIINTGQYITEIPASVIDYCNRNDFPLMTVPWDIYLVDMIKDLSIRVFLQGTTDEEISSAMIRAIEDPDARDLYVQKLLPYFDTDGVFQVILITSDDLDKMDTVIRRRISFRIQQYLMNITHNGHFFYYNSDFVLITNAMEPGENKEIIAGFLDRMKFRMPEFPVYIGVGSRIRDVTKLHISYQRARAAAAMAMDRKESLVVFDQMGLYRILYSLQDRKLLDELCKRPLRPLLEYDQKHDSEYVRTLELYLINNESIQAVAEAMFTHRNTILYRMKNIRKMLGTDLKSTEDKMTYIIACRILSMYRKDKT